MREIIKRKIISIKERQKDQKKRQKCLKTHTKDQ